DGPGRITVGTDNERRDALSDLRFGEGIGVEATCGVIVNVDEAGGEDKAFGVQNLFGFGGFEVADSGDVRTSDAEVRFAERNAGTVGDLGIDDNEGSLLGKERRCARTQQQNCEGERAAHGDSSEKSNVFLTQRAQRTQRKEELRIRPTSRLSLKRSGVRCPL